VHTSVVMVSSVAGHGGLWTASSSPIAFSGRRNRAVSAPCRAIHTIYGTWRSAGGSDTGLPAGPLQLEDAARKCLLAGEAHPSLSVWQGGGP
jgi:hypothetical protein